MSSIFLFYLQLLTLLLTWLCYDGADGCIVQASPVVSRASMRSEPSLKRTATLALVALIALAVASWHFTFLLDDPYITFRYARNLAGGRGLVFNPGERVEGYTNFLWVILLALVIRLGGDPILWSKVLGTVFHLGTILCLWKISRRTLKGSGSFVISLLIVSWLALNWNAAIWAVGGLETSMFTLYLLFAFLAHSRRRLVLASTCLLLASITRPEGTLFFLLLVIIEAYRPSEAQKSRTLIKLFSPFLTGFAAFLIFRFSYYGELLPNTYYAKTGGPLLWTLSRGTRYISFFAGSLVGLRPTGEDILKAEIPALTVIAAGLLLAGLILVVVRALRKGDWGVSIGAFWVLGQISYLVLIGGDWMPGYRFIVPVLPFLALAGAYLLAGTVDADASPRRKLVLVASAGFVLLSSWGQWSALQVQVPWLKPFWTTGYFQPHPIYHQVALWLNENTAPADLIAIEEAGLIPYYCEGRKFIDLYGLTDKRLARAPGLPPFEKKDDGYVLSRAPDFAVLGVFYGEDGSLAWAPHLSMIESDEFNEKYRQVRSISRGAGGAFLIYERIQSKSE